MITDREITEYRTLHNTLVSLHEKFLVRKQELCRLLEETAALRRDAFKVLARANRLTRYLTGHQRQITGLSYHLNEIQARVNRLNQFTPVLFQEEPVKADALPEIRNEFQSTWELKQKGLVLLSFIDRLRKSLLQLDLLELRCRELILSIKKAMEAFYHESRTIRRKLYPFGFLSLLYRSVRSLWGKNYFSPGDLGEISALGRITAGVLKIADSSVI